MEETNQVPGGNETEGGANGQNSEKNKFVPRDTYENLLDETKSFKSKYRDAMAKLNEYESKAKAELEAKQIEEKKYLEVIDSLKSEKEQIAKQNEIHVREKQDFRKMSALLGTMQQKGVNIESKYYDLLPLDQIGFDNDGNIDGSSLASATETFMKEHPRLTTPIGKLLPNQQSGGVSESKKLTKQEWLKLGPKERAEAYKTGRVKMPD